MEYNIIMISFKWSDTENGFPHDGTSHLEVCLSDALAYFLESNFYGKHAFSTYVSVFPADTSFSSMAVTTSVYSGLQNS